MIPMRSLLLTSSLAALMVASPALAQQEPEASVPEVIVIQELPPSGNRDADVPEGEDGEPADTEVPQEQPEPVVPIPAVWAPIPVDAEGTSAYGYYLAGRYWLSLSETDRGAAELAQAYRLTPEQPRLREQAFTANLLAGDLAFAAEIAPESGELSPVISEAGRLLRGIHLYATEGARQANTYFGQNAVGTPHDRAATYAQVWIAAEARDWDRALASPPTDFDPISALVARSNRARILELRRRHDEADAEWKELVSHAAAGALFRLPYGEFLERRGRRQEALALYDLAIEANQADGRIQAARARIESGARPPAVPTPREGLAMALRTASDQVIAQGAHEFGAVYLRMSQMIAPEDQTQLQIGHSLIAGGLHAAGRAALEQVSRDDVDYFAASRVQRGMSFSEANRDEEALAEFRIASEARPEHRAYAYILASHLVGMERHEQALELLEGPLLNTRDQSFEVRFLRGAAYESVGRLNEAEAELWAAYQAAPNNPTVLNYLGYLWVDRGDRVAEGAEMIARAHAASPEDGHIQDSLGWAQFKMGRHEDALVNLEGAVAKLPGNAEINDHLGDVYWAVGRQREAGFQWDRVLTLDVDEKRRDEVLSKLRERLGRGPVATADVVVAAD